MDIGKESRTNEVRKGGESHEDEGEIQRACSRGHGSWYWLGVEFRHEWSWSAFLGRIREWRGGINGLWLTPQDGEVGCCNEEAGNRECPVEENLFPEQVVCQDFEEEEEDKRNCHDKS